jgi:tetratricopeptide (TPR) repeat protein
MRRPPTDPVSCLVRGNAVLRHDPDEALVWYRRALQLDPASRMALRNLAHVLAERQGDTAAAIRVVDRLVEQFGHRPEDLVSRGVLHARAGDRQAALADAQSALAGRQDGKLLFQVACIHALCAGQNPEDAEQAIQLVGQAIVKDPRWLQVAMRDPDLVSLRNQEKFRELIRAAATMQHVIKSVGTLNTEDTQAE